MKRMILSVACAVIGLSSINAGAAIVTPSGDSDGVVWRSWYGWNGYGVDGLASTSLGGAFDSSNRYWQLPVMEFNVADFNGQAIKSASLALFVTSPSGGNSSVRYNGAGTGTIHVADYLNSGSTCGIINGGTSGWVNFDVTSAIQDAANNGYAWAVFAVAVPNYDGIGIAASESGLTAPQLTVVPEPATMALLSLGSLVSLYSRKK